MAGTDMGFSGDPLSINNNTAGIAISKQAQFSTVIEPVFMNGIRHADSLNNDDRSGNDRAILISSAWSTPLENHSDITVGLGFFAQGGVGFDYTNLNTAFGTTDDLTAMFGVFRLAPAIAWNVNDKLRIGFSGSINYSQAEQEIFPNTSDAGSGFAGLEIEDLSGVSYAWRAGLQYDINEQLTLGIAYGSDTKLVLKNGNATANFEAMGLGRVKYNSAKIDGLSLPSELGIGLAWQVSPQLTLGADFNYYRWRKALGKVSTTLSEAQTTGAPDSIKLTNDFGGQNQFARSIGAKFKLNDQTQITAGINHLGNIIKHGYESPLNNLLAKWHFTAGVNHEIAPHWETSIGYVYVPKIKRQYTNTQLPLGSDAEETCGAHWFAFGLTYTW
ncbi:OmpP1/FadL family transporter [Zhongshania sp. BJYM1]|uniref:OmpP1/FadL family transporter n=1 Tax=Zhongshania aquatica TaxID=2965069 RepID=UPI0022B52F58|nr:outer membrane protein transport protein [Marortus sp. BJYM1]